VCSSDLWDANGYRLPTEMEWMWAAMGAPADGQGGGTNTTGYDKAFAGSTGSNVIDDYVWYNSNSENKRHPAGTKLANELGLYDMSGNVWEWCWDWYGDSYYTGTQTDYQGPAWGGYRVNRGGCWANNAADCTVANRSFNQPNYYSTIGFRVVHP
jgi:formylglycine-generating enzyme required for sulfatase activity